MANYQDGVLKLTAGASLVARGVHDITVLGGERHAPYNRILLSAVLKGTHSVEAITLRSPEW